LIDRAKYLDKMYIPTRYPNAWSEGAPYQYYTEEEARRAIDISREIIEYIEGRWRTLKSYAEG
jgi:HEPN domain-containing protein